tara:strand:- start:682 stop:891 length:210 start_codon:yes stop_codon:yes gene_type:complete
MKMKKSRSFSFDDKLLGLVDDLRRKLTLGNRSAVVRRALVLLDLAVKAEEEGGKLCIRNGDSFAIINLK